MMQRRATAPTNPLTGATTTTTTGENYSQQKKDATKPAQTHNFYQDEILRIANDKRDLNEQLSAAQLGIEKPNQRNFSIVKEAFMTTKHQTINYDGILNTPIPDQFEDQLQECLIIRPITFSTEEEVREEYKHHFNKDMDAQLARMGSVVQYEKDNDLGVFIRTDLQKIADRSEMAFGKEFNNMSKEEKQIFLARMQDKEDQKRIKELLNFGDDEEEQDKVNELKQELQKIER